MEFGGVPGTAALTVIVPLVVLLVTHKDWLSFPYVSIPLLGIDRTGAGLPDLLTDPLAFVVRAATWQGFAIVAGWWLLHVLLHVLLPGENVLGSKLSNGKQLPYKINGLSCVLTAVAMALGWHALVVSGALNMPAESYSLLWLAQDSSLEQLGFAAVVLSSAKSVWLYLASFEDGKLLAPHGNTGYAVYDFFMGRELNPRVRVLGVDVDLKFFNELRPGMSAWLLLAVAPVLQHLADCGVLGAEHRRAGVAAGTVSLRPEMLVVAALQVVYVVDSVLFERAILTTIDIITDGFGFMLCVGDLAWVPFAFSLQTRFLLANQTDPLPLHHWLLAAAVGVAGFIVFRLSNIQKDVFKRNMDAPAVSALATIPPRSEAPRANGGRLLAGGWWATARHINYLGDWMLGLAWCLLTGFRHPVPYLYAAYFAVLLVHRERRDDHKCAAKYGAHWDTYRAAVPWRIVPWLY